jgi:hypothetical protein
MNGSHGAAIFKANSVDDIMFWNHSSIQFGFAQRTSGGVDEALSTKRIQEQHNKIFRNKTS